MFILPEEIQEVVIQKMAKELFTGGKLLFTAPSQKMKWNDAITERESISLGAERYNELLAASGLSLIKEFQDERENHYYHAEKR